jgi:hypothetical protein
MAPANSGSGNAHVVVGSGLGFWFENVRLQR